jgi:hypothetical protein
MSALAMLAEAGNGLGHGAVPRRRSMTVMQGVMFEEAQMRDPHPIELNTARAEAWKTYLLRNDPLPLNAEHGPIVRHRG